MKSFLRKNRIFLTLAVASVAVALFLTKSLPLLNAAKGQGDLYVSHVIDGDTVELLNGEKVRYIGIDTPELRDRTPAGWVYNPRPYAEKAKKFNKRLVEGKKVTLEFDVQKKDSYGRLLAYLYIDGKMVNLEIVKEGYAMVYTYPPNLRHTEKFLNAQKEAKENERGLWSSMGEGIISSSEAGKNMGLIRTVHTRVIDTYLSKKALILDCEDDFKVVIFKKNLEYFPKAMSRSPESYLKYKNISVYGVIREYKGANEIIIDEASQLEILNN